MGDLRFWAVGLAGVLLFACGDDDGGTDAGTDGFSALECMETSDCDDGLFCNGAEACTGGECVDGTAPCPMGMSCDEEGDRCVSCAVAPDMDGDGADSVECGGDDCDDSDPNAFPGNPEVCDDMGHDEDCDPLTFGVRDMDGDGFDDAMCCNGEECGSDCNDMQPAVFAGATEVCNARDDDCDGTVDEGVLITFYRDRDSDTYGDDATTVNECSLPTGFAARGGDCIDDPTVEPLANQFNPGEPEECDLIDNDCDMAIDEGLTCACIFGTDAPRACGFDPVLDGVGNCRLGTQMCLSGGVWSECAGASPPVDEVCNLDDDDCDGDTDEGVEVTCWEDIDRDGFAVSGAPSMIACPPCPDGNTDMDPAVAADCDDSDETIYPGATEVCDGRDQDCSRGGGAEPAEDRDGDRHTAIGFAGCEGGYPKDDCIEYDPRVYGGQVDYFGKGYCDPGWCFCDDGRCFFPGALSLCPIGGCAVGTEPANFDFDCDGSETRQPGVDGTHCSCFMGATCPAPAPAIYSGTPACGSSVNLISCSGTCACTPSTVTGDMPCR